LGGFSRVFRFFINKGADVNAQGSYYGNALYTTSYEGYREIIVRLLIKKGADVNA
ncbi:receptor-interacting serine/threonine-protein kinase, partial [Colletotrichum lupini]